MKWTSLLLLSTFRLGPVSRKKRVVRSGTDPRAGGLLSRCRTEPSRATPAMSWEIVASARLNRGGNVSTIHRFQHAR